MNYFNIHRHPLTGKKVLSNSGLKAMYAEVIGEKVNKARRDKNFEFGGRFHEMILEPEVFAASRGFVTAQERIMAQRMASALYREYDSEFFEMCKKEIEMFGSLLGYHFKCKVDLLLQLDVTRFLTRVTTGPLSNDYYYEGRKEYDLKTTGASSQREFEKNAEAFGYDCQTYIYLNVGKAESMTMIGIQKTRKNPKVYQMNEIDRYHPFYKSGEKKVKFYLEKCKHLINN